MKEPKFPLVDAILVTPDEGVGAKLAICTNATMAPGQVYSEIEPDLGAEVAVLGSLKVNRDGTERMVVNSLVHPSIQDVILFGTETSSFRPSSNLLQALRFGVDPQDANRVINGHNSNAQYPNLHIDHIDVFRESIRVLPIYMSEVRGTSDIVEQYIDWLSERTDEQTIEILRQINSRPNKIYFDALNRLVRHLGGQATRDKISINLQAEDFQQLQPPLREIDEGQPVPTVPFRVTRNGTNIQIELQLSDEVLRFQGSNPFLLGYTVLQTLGEQKEKLSPLEQLTLGAEVSRVTAELNNSIVSEDLFSLSDDEFTDPIDVMAESITRLKTDSQYYYMVSIKDGSKISVMCMAHDQCESVYEIQGSSAIDLIAKLAEDNRFEGYEMDLLHRFDIGMQIGRAYIALKNGLEFVQDFDNIFEVNTEKFPLLTVEADNFLTGHHDLLREIYTRGITAEHGDRQKGLARSAAILAIYRTANTAFASMPRVYMQGGQTTEQMREEYKNQLLRLDHDGSYSYGERTRSYFGFDQLEAAVSQLVTNPGKAYIIQRFDPTKDMFYGVDDEGRPVSSEDPCLTHDIVFIVNGEVHTFHIARAHNAVNAYPENLYGLHDAYDTRISSGLNLPLGDMFMLSSRANILLLTEEQKARRIISMSVKPIDDVTSNDSGPFKVGDGIKMPQTDSGITYCEQKLRFVTDKPDSKLLSSLEDMSGVNLIERAINYLRQKGADHNNALIGTFIPNSSYKEMAQEEHLAFFQVNMMGDKLYATAVFTNRAGKREEDIDLTNYLASLYSTELGIELGNLVYFNIQGQE